MQHSRQLQHNMVIMRLPEHQHHRHLVHMLMLQVAMERLLVRTQNQVEIRVPQLAILHGLRGKVHLLLVKTVQLQVITAQLPALVVLRPVSYQLHPGILQMRKETGPLQQVQTVMLLELIVRQLVLTRRLQQRVVLH